MFTAYVLSDQTGRLYKGVTSNLSRRLIDHKKGNTRTTRKMQNLNVVYSEEYQTFEAARKREVYFKSAAGRRFLKKILGL